MVIECSNPEDVFEAAVSQYIDLFHPANATECRANCLSEYNQLELVLEDANSSDFSKLLTDVMQAVAIG
jgi:hypothetical protein